MSMRWTLLAGLVLACVACDDTEPWAPPEREFSDFQVVHEVLLRDCGFHDCHGAPERAFRVYGPGRARLDPETGAYDQLKALEASDSWIIAKSFIDARNPEDSLLLRKPLAVAAGGAPHGGLDAFGRDVYRTVNDAGYLALQRFVLAVPAPEPPAPQPQP
jgi:hypothetical protein